MVVFCPSTFYIKEDGTPDVDVDPKVLSGRFYLSAICRCYAIQAIGPYLCFFWRDS